MHNMTAYFSIKPSTVHLWRIWLPDWVTHVPALSSLLSEDEKERADRFHFAIHCERFIIARAFLRKILHLYTDVSPEKIQFSYGARGKPALISNPLLLNFNLAHSHDMAVYALIVNEEIGVDIEKIGLEDKINVAQRFFSKEEVAALAALPMAERSRGFYQIWSKKEAFIKLLGEGLFAPLNEFSVSATEKNEIVLMQKAGTTASYVVESFTAHPEYQAAFATQSHITAVSYWQWSDSGPISW